VLLVAQLVGLAPSADAAVAGSATAHSADTLFTGDKVRS
jgi:hypothetical protein